MHQSSKLCKVASPGCPGLHESGAVKKKKSVQRTSFKETLAFLFNLVLFHVLFSSHFNHASRLKQSFRRGGNHPFTFMDVIIYVVVSELPAPLTSQWSQLQPKEDVSLAG